MPENPEEIITGSIDDYLLALADGIVKAQSELNKISVQSSPGQPAVQYQMPKLDFELKMSFSLEKETKSESGNTAKAGRSGILGAFGRKIPRLQAAPVNPQTSSEDFSAEAVSTIKGSFIALPINGGKPPNVLGLTLIKHEKAFAQIKISLGNAAGETIPNQTIALSVDREFSQSLNEERGLPKTKQTLQHATDFKESQVTTDENGSAVATLLIHGQEAPKVSIVIEASVANITETLIIHQS